MPVFKVRGARGTNLFYGDDLCFVGTPRARELRLPDHVLVKDAKRVTIVERASGDTHSFTMPIKPIVIKTKSHARFLAALACAVLALYFSYMFMPNIFSSNLEIIALPLIIGVPFVFDRITSGKVALAAYLTVFLIFAACQGGLTNKELRLGVIFFGGGPVSYTGYTIVPASDLIVVLFLGVLPYAVLTMVGQVLVSFDIGLSSERGEYSIRIRHAGMVKEILSFLECIGD